MTDDNMNSTLNSTSADDELQSTEGEETDELESGDDLAAQALEEVSSSAPSIVSKNDPVALAESLTSLQNVIERNASELARIKDELKEYRDSLKNLFENDTELAEAEEQATLVTQKLKERKTRIQASAEATQLKAHIGELSEMKKEVEEALNNHLLNLYQITGAKTVDTSDGDQLEFNIRASIKGKKSPKQAE